jgi:hypothetical protein
LGLSVTVLKSILAPNGIVIGPNMAFSWQAIETSARGGVIG